MRFAIPESAAWRNVDGHIFVITEDSRQHELVGEVETLVWSLVDEAPRSQDELAAAVADAFDVSSARAASDLDLFLSAMVDAGVFHRI